MADVAFRTAAGDDDARIVLIQDGVLLAPDLDADGEAPDFDHPAYAVARDAEVRGVDLPPGIEPVSYDTLMTLVEEYEVKTFA